MTTPVPARKAFAITPSDSAVIEGATRGVWVGGAGNLAVLMVNDSSAITFSGVPAGTLLPIQVQKVMSTNTTATLIVGVT